MEERLVVPDVSCGHCKAAIEEALRPVAGVRRAEVDLEAKSVVVAYDDSAATRSIIVAAIESAGYAVAGEGDVSGSRGASTSGITPTIGIRRS